jgi:hypothetical protein
MYYLMSVQKLHLYGCTKIHIKEKRTWCFWNKLHNLLGNLELFIWLWDSAGANGGSCFCAHMTLRSAPHQHQRKFYSKCVCKKAFTIIPKRGGGDGKHKNVEDRMLWTTLYTYMGNSHVHPYIWTYSLKYAFQKVLPKNKMMFDDIRWHWERGAGDGMDTWSLWSGVRPTLIHKCQAQAVFYFLVLMIL